MITNILLIEKLLLLLFLFFLIPFLYGAFAGVLLVYKEIFKMKKED